MVKNIGSPDKIVRILAAVVFAVLILAGTVTGTVAIILGVLGVVLFATALMNFCPLYFVAKLSTLKAKH